MTLRDIQPTLWDLCPRWCRDMCRQTFTDISVNEMVFTQPLEVAWDTGSRWSGRQATVLKHRTQEQPRERNSCNEDTAVLQVVTDDTRSPLCQGRLLMSPPWKQEGCSSRQTQRPRATSVSTKLCLSCMGFVQYDNIKRLRY